MNIKYLHLLSGQEAQPYDSCKSACNTSTWHACSKKVTAISHCTWLQHRLHQYISLLVVIVLMMCKEDIRWPTSSREVTRITATAAGPHDALCQLKSCKLLHSCTKNHSISETVQHNSETLHGNLTNFYSQTAVILPKILKNFMKVMQGIRSLQGIYIPCTPHMGVSLARLS